MTLRKNYTVGFAFSKDRSKIVLIRKNRPAWQAGKLNGAGGKIDPEDKDAAHAMAREFLEETGVETAASQWRYFARIMDKSHAKDENGVVHFFSIFDDKVLQAKTNTDEEVVIIDTNLDAIRKQGMANLGWLVGIALDETQPIFFVEAHYDQDFVTGETGTQ